MDKEGMLQALFSSVGSDYGFGEVTAGFTPEKDMKIIWMRAFGWIDFWISDYLEDAPAEVRLYAERIRRVFQDCEEENGE